MKKKWLSGILAIVMAVGMMTGCGNSDSGKTNGNTGGAANQSEEGKVLNIRCWNEEFKSRMADHYPGYEAVDATTGKIGDVTVKWTIVPNEDNAYQNALDEALLEQESVAADEKIDLFLVEADYALKYVNTEYTMDIVNDLGVAEGALSEQYQYTKDVVTDENGKLKGVSWQACPGTMIYRRDVAKEVFGTDDPDKIQEYFNDWDKFLEAASKLKDAGYCITASSSDTYRVFSNNVTSKWVEDGKINMDPNIQTWIDMSKEMVEKGYTHTYGLWSDDWSKGFTTAGNVFCYFGPAWFLDFTLGGHDLDGQWATTVGPQSFYWGGSWLCGATGTDNASLVKDIIEKLTCDKDIMTEIAKEDNDFVNNRTAMETLAKDESFGDKVLGGQNPLPIYCEGVEKIDLSNISAYDLGCAEELQTAVGDYFDNNTTYEEAMDIFYKNVMTKYPELTR